MDGAFFGDFPHKLILDRKMQFPPPVKYVPRLYGFKIREQQTVQGEAAVEEEPMTRANNQVDHQQT